MDEASCTAGLYFLALVPIMFLCFYLGYRLGSRSDAEARQARENSRLCLEVLGRDEPLMLKTVSRRGKHAGR